MDLKLKAESRKAEEKMDAKSIAGVLYGKGIETKSLRLDYQNFVHVFSEAGESNLIDLDFEGVSRPVLVKEVQKDVLKGNYIHVDFYQVNMKEKVKTEIPLKFIGESKAVRELGGIFIENMDTISVECLPGDLVDHLEVDITPLVEFGDVIRVSDLKVPETISLFHEEGEVVCGVEAPRKIEEVETSSEESGEEEKKEGEETEEGAAKQEGEKKED